MNAGFVAVVAGMVAHGTLLASGTGHLARPRRFAAALAAHGVRATARRLLSVAVPVAELLVGGAGLMLIGTGSVSGGRAAALGAVVLYSAFAGYGWRLTRRRPGVPCGCGASLEPVSGWTVARAAALSATAAVAATGVALAGPAAPPAERVLAVLSAAGLGLALWQLPAARLGSLSRARW